MSKVKLLATADVHSPKYLGLYLESLRAVDTSVDAVIWAGDMIYRGRVEALREVLEATKREFPDTPIIAVFGNEEYWGLEEKLRKAYPEVTWLDDELAVINVKGAVKLGVVGTRGALDRPTRWQRTHMPHLWRVYSERPKKIESLVQKAKSKASLVIVVSHYALAQANLEGEPRSIWPELGSRQMEEAIRRSKPDAGIHGHAHNSKNLETRVDGVPVYNVSIVARKSVALIDVERAKHGLELFM